MPVIEYLIDLATAHTVNGFGGGDETGTGQQVSTVCETVARLSLTPEVARLVTDDIVARLDLDPQLVRVAFDEIVGRLGVTPITARISAGEIVARILCPGGIVPDLPQTVIKGADTVLPFHLVTEANGVDSNHDLSGDSAIEFYLKDSSQIADTASGVVKYALATGITITNAPGTDGRLTVQTLAADVNKTRKWFHLDTVKSGKRTVWAYGYITRTDV